jgi:LETM1 and EF-hand domain-containing protein 1
VAASGESGVAAVDKVKGREPATSGMEATKDAEEKKIVEEKKEAKKLTIGQKIKKEVQHYWDGTKLLATEVRISTKLALKMAAGYELSRRENRQVRSSFSAFGGDIWLTGLVTYSCNERSKICLVWSHSLSLS